MSSPTLASILRGRALARSAVCSDVLVVTGLIGLDVAARLVPHAPNFAPVAASALFAASVLRVRAASFFVPVLGLLLGDAAHGFYDWRLMATVYAALTFPACAACLSSRLRGPRMILPVMLSCSVIFFVTTNFAVWALGTMYAANSAGLITCYVAALPFLKYTISGDLFWSAALFGGYWLMQNLLAPDSGRLKAFVAIQRSL